MDEEERIDFSVLDPKSDPRRFEWMVQAVLSGLQPQTPLVNPLLLGLVRLGRTAVAVAALFAIVTWLPSLTRSPSTTATASKSDPVEVVMSWADQGAVPSNVDWVQALGGTNER